MNPTGGPTSIRYPNLCLLLFQLGPFPQTLPSPGGGWRGADGSCQAVATPRSHTTSVCSNCRQTGWRFADGPHMTRGGTKMEPLMKFTSQQLFMADKWGIVLHLCYIPGITIVEAGALLHF